MEPGMRNGFLAFILALLVVDTVLCLCTSKPYPGGRGMLLIVPLMLLFNHLAYQFRWSRRVTAFWRITAWVWLIFGSYYIYVVVMGQW
jgi:hypothetical protein